MNKNIGTIITSIAIAAFLVFWSTIDNRLRTLETEIRSLRIQVTAVSTKLGVEWTPSLMNTEAQLNEQRVQRPGEDTKPLLR
jgi:hypothetical protein